ncbi:MAG TPA: hypothetical protein ENL16_02060 [Candidatus Woesearchaeota archaeon]|nr:hypothetical protein [Candidatus Woesearchaeota archaeon]
MARKSQVATEFMLVVGLAMIIITILAGVLYSLSYNYSEEKNINRLRDLGYSLQSELILASQVEPGYERTIIIPNDVNGVSYSISQSDNNLVITYKGTELLFPIPVVTGTLTKGTNTIRKPDANNVVIS